MNLSIPVNRKRVPASLLLYTGIAVAWWWLMRTQNFGPQYNWLLGLSLVMLVIRVSLLLVDYVKTLFDQGATLTITAEGIDDRRSIFSCGLIPWSAITAFDLYQGRRMKLLVIRMADAEALMAAQPFWKRVFLREQSKRFGSPVVVSESSVKYDLTILQSEVTHFLQSESTHLIQN